MKKVLLILSFTVGWFMIVAQEMNITDSLINELPEMKEDTNKVLVYSKILHELMYNDPERSLTYGEQGMDLSDDLNFLRGLASIANNLAVAYEKLGNVDKALEYFKKSVDYEKQRNNNYGIATSYLNMGTIFKNQGEYKKAIEYMNMSIKEFEANNLLLEASYCYLNLAITYDEQGIYEEAYKLYLKALRINEDIEEGNVLSDIYLNLGVFFDNQDDIDKALEYYFKALEIFKQQNDLSRIANVYNNIACEYDDKGDTVEALEYYFLSLELYKKTKIASGIALVSSNIGGSYRNAGKLDTALQYYETAANLYHELQYKEGLADLYTNMGLLYKLRKDNSTAIDYLLKAFKIGDEIGNLSVIQKSSQRLNEIYNEIGAFGNAYYYLNRFMNSTDSLKNEENVKKITQLQMQYDFDKERKVAELESEKIKTRHEAEIEIKNAKLNQQKILTGFFILLFVLMVIFALFIYRSFRQKKKMNKILFEQKEQILEKNEELHQQKEEIESQRDQIEAQRDKVQRQKDVVDQQKEEIDDSIRYAKHIQTAVLPDLEGVLAISRHESGRANNDIEYFVVFRPKDIVSGDFYWAVKTNKHTIIAVADCTGHGVPGAFMSMLGVSFLNEIVKNKGVTNPADILNELRFYVINALKQSGDVGAEKDIFDERLASLKREISLQSIDNDEEITHSKHSFITVKDGMDMSIISISNDLTKSEHKNTYCAQWAGANNPLYIIRDNELSVYKGDKMPVAIHIEMSDFVNHDIELIEGDQLYLFTDGFPDQFGGPDGKKFKYKPFRQLLTSNCQLSMSAQKVAIEAALDSWLSDSHDQNHSYEQVDDITIIGLKIPDIRQAGSMGKQILAV